jgi:hypothetical protein
MSMKKSVLLLVIAVVICFLVFLDFRKEPETATTDASGTALQVSAFERVAPDNVERVEIELPEGKGTIELKKAGDGWKVLAGDKQYAVDENRAKRLFGITGTDTELKGPLEMTLQAKNPENFPEFDLTNEKATRVKFYGKNDDLLEDILVGKAGTDWQSTYVRRPEADEVYLVPVRLADNFTGDDVNAWRDKRIFPGLEPQDIRNVYVDDRANTRTYALTRIPIAGENADPAAAYDWRLTLPEDTKARKAAADSVARTLVTLNAIEFLEPAEVQESDFQPPTLRAKFSAGDATTSYTLTVGQESGERGRFYARASTQEEPFVVYKPYALAMPLDSLKETPTPTPSPSPSPPLSSSPEPPAPADDDSATSPGPSG